MAGRLAAAGIDPSSLAQVTGLFNLLAALVVLVMTAVLVAGVRESANVNAVMVVVKVAVMVVFIAAGLAYVKVENWQPFVPENTGEFGRYGWSGIVRGAAVVFFAYMGFDSVATAAQEAKHPQRDLPIGILGSLLICARALRPGGGGADRPRALHGAERPRSLRGGHGCHSGCPGSRPSSSWGRSPA